jgi:hypothetical protein
VLGDVSQLLLGDTLFMSNLTITFDKINSRVGFEGSTQPLIQIGNGHFLVGQYVMVAFMGLIILFGFITCIRSDTLIKKKHIVEELGRELV